jgi:hypothetical protein
MPFLIVACLLLLALAAGSRMPVTVAETPSTLCLWED